MFSSPSTLTRVPVVAGPAYTERIQRLPSTFTVTVRADPDNRFNHAAVAVLSGGAVIGFLPPELSRHYYESLKATPGGVECHGRHAPLSAHEDTGVDVLLDLTGIPWTA